MWSIVIDVWSILQPTTRGLLKRLHRYIQTGAGVLGGSAVQLQDFYDSLACFLHASLWGFSSVLCQLPNFWNLHMNVLFDGLQRGL